MSARTVLRSSLIYLSAALAASPLIGGAPALAQQYSPTPGEASSTELRASQPMMDNTQVAAPSKQPLTGYAYTTPELNGYATGNPPLNGFAQGTPAFNGYAAGGAPLNGNLNAMGVPPLTPMQGNLANQAPFNANVANQAPLNANAANQAFNMAADQMRNHDVCILIDKSYSMLERDCPGDLSRWEWCQQQSRGLAMAAAQAASNLTVALFSSDYKIYEHVQPGIIPAIFSANKPWDGTKLAPPLTAMLTGYFKERSINPHARPLIVAVITDGCPKDMKDVEHVIIDAANNTVRPGEISISFLVVGTQGAAQMEDLDGGLMARGARHDIVNLIQFNNLKRLGTAQALAMALSGRQFRNAPHSKDAANMFFDRSQSMGGMPTNSGPGLGGLFKALTQ